MDREGKVRKQQKGQQKCKSNLKGKKRKTEQELNLDLGERSAQGKERRKTNKERMSLKPQGIISIYLKLYIII